MNIFKKITALLTIGIVLLSLTSCDNDVRVDANVVGHRTSISIEATLIDPYSRVGAGSFSVRVYSEDDTLQGSHTFTNAPTLQEHEFQDLPSRYDEFTVRFQANIGGSVQTIRTFTVEMTDDGSSRKYARRIYNAQEFLNIRGDRTAYFVLMNDIDLGYGLEDDDATKREIASMFTDIRPFEGTLFSYGDNNFTISNFRIVTAARHIGLFGYIGSDGVIENVNFDNVEVRVSRAVLTNVGVLAGTNEGRIENVNVSNVDIRYTKTGSGRLTLGGVVGLNTERGIIRDTTIYNANLNITTRNDAMIGGLVGRNENTMLAAGIEYAAKIDGGVVRATTITITHNLTTSQPIRLRVGGFIGMNQARIENSISEAIINITSNLTGGTPDEYRVVVGGFAATNTAGGSIENVITASRIDVTSNTLDNIRASLFVAEVFAQNVRFNNIAIVGTHSEISLNITTDDRYLAALPSNATHRFDSVIVDGNAFDEDATLYNIITETEDATVEELVAARVLQAIKYDRNIEAGNEDFLITLAGNAIVRILHEVLSELYEESTSAPLDDNDDEEDDEPKFTRGDFSIRLNVSARTLEITIDEREEREDYSLQWGIVTATKGINNNFENIYFIDLTIDDILDTNNTVGIIDNLDSVTMTPDPEELNENFIDRDHALYEILTRGNFIFTSDFLARPASAE